jgi:phosphoglycolate phosphatase
MENARKQFNNSPSWQVHIQQQHKAKLVITDVDGTLASFWDYFVPAMREYLSHVRNHIDFEIEHFSRDMGHVIDRRGTHEYPWLLESTGFARDHFKDNPGEFQSKFVAPFWQALDENRNKYLRPYPTVLDTLEELKRRGLKVVALSDAPDYMARVRNKQIFDGMLDAVYALDTREPQAHELFTPEGLEYGRARLSSLREAFADCKSPVHVLPTHYEKPNAMGVDQVMQDFGVFPHEVIFVGDSVIKDGLAAASRGMRFVWAHYGTHLPAEYDEMIHYSLKPEGREPSAQPYLLPPAVAVAARYDEILNHV